MINNIGKFRRYNNITYFIEQNCVIFRKSILNNFLISNCDIYNNIIRQALYMWSTVYSSNFIETQNIHDNNLLFNASLLEDNILGLCKNSVHSPDIIIKSEIFINNKKCYQNYHNTCDIINKVPMLNLSMYYALIVSIVFSIFGTIIFFIESSSLCRSFWEKNYIITKIYYVMYSILLYVYWYDVRSCFECYDLMYIILHELGHAFGLHHSEVSFNSIMEPIYNDKSRNCIYGKDLISYNNLYNNTINTDICNTLNDTNFFFLTDIAILLFCFLSLWGVLKLIYKCRE